VLRVRPHLLALQFLNYRMIHLRTGTHTSTM